METENTAMVFKPSMLYRLTRKIFPYQIPARWNRRTEEEEKLQPFFSVTDCRFGFIDRLRILVTGRVRVEVDHYCDVVPKSVTSKSWVTVLRKSLDG